MTEATTDLVWREQDTTPGDIEAAVRKLVNEAHAANASHVPGRVLNLVCVVDKEYSGEIANRLRGVGRFHPSRTIVLSVSPKREKLDAVATIAEAADVKADEPTAGRETVIVEVGERHLAHLDRIVDPLVVTDLPTLVWSPHGHPEAVDALTDMCQVVLLDSVDEPDISDALARASKIAESGTYVVDLAWLRSTPWRERIAATFDPAHLRPDLKLISAVTVRHHPESAAAALLLLGWMGAQLHWKVERLTHHHDGSMSGKAHTRRHLELDRGPGGVRARYRNAKDTEREWTILGASRGEAGILGEGIRQALLRDPVYQPSLAAAAKLAG